MAGPGAGADPEGDTVAKETSAAGFVESDYKGNGAIERVICELHEEPLGQVYDAISREPMDKDLIKKARIAKLETFRKHGAYEKASIDECWKETGRER